MQNVKEQAGTCIVGLAVANALHYFFSACASTRDLFCSWIFEIESDDERAVNTVFGGGNECGLHVFAIECQESVAFVRHVCGFHRKRG